MSDSQQICELTVAVGRLTAMVELLLEDRGVVEPVPVVRRDSVRRAEALARSAANAERRALRRAKKD